MFDINEPATWPEIGKLDEELAELVRDNPKPQYTREGDDYLATRREWTAMARKEANEALEAAKEDVKEHEIQIPVKGSVMRALVYAPKRSSPSGCPLLVLFHGGAFCYGPPEFESVNCINAAKAYGCVAMTLDYPLAPETKWPHVLYRSWEAIQWIASHTSELGADTTQGFLIGGCSAGSLIAAVCVHWAQDQGLSPPLTGAHYSVAGFGSPQNFPEKYRDYHTSSQNSEVVLWKRPTKPYDALAAVELDFDSPLWNVVSWKTGHAGHPPAYFQLCGLDTTRDDSLIMERILRDDGVKTKVDIYPGLPHIFWMSYPEHSMRPKYIQDTLKGVRWLLGKGEHEAVTQDPHRLYELTPNGLFRLQRCWFPPDSAHRSGAKFQSSARTVGNEAGLFNAKVAHHE
ncbi:hypothetical protein AUP68_12124 [Ilyonectria robusta]